MSVSKLEQGLIRLCIENYAVTNVEELFELVPIELTSSGKTKLWTFVDSQLFGKFIPHIPYTAVKTLYTKRGKDAVEAVRSKAKYGWQAVTDERNNQLYPNALYNIKNVIGVLNPENLSRNDLRDWEKVKRGQDLFIEGLGSFDINRVVEEVIKEQEQTFRYAPGYRVASLQAVGYLGSIDYHNVIKNKTFMKHIKRHWAAWNVYGFGHIIEILNGLTSDLLTAEQREKYLTYSPEKLYNIIRTAQEERSALHLKANEIEINTPFKELAIPETDLQIQVVGNFEELKLVGMELNNCIGSVYYAKRALVGLSGFLLIQWKGETYVCDLNLFSGKINQLKGKNNLAAPSALREELNKLCVKISKLNEKGA